MFIVTIEKFWDDFTYFNETFTTENIEQVFSKMYSFVEKSQTGKEEFDFGIAKDSKRIWCKARRVFMPTGYTRYKGDAWLNKIVFSQNSQDVVVFESNKYTSPKLFELCKEELIPFYNNKTKPPYGDF